MNPSRFWGKDMASALHALRSSLGSDALILETRAAQNGGGIEILALADAPPTERQGTSSFSLPKRPDVFSTHESDGMHAPLQTVSLPSGDMREELAALRSMLSWLAPGLNHKNRILKSLVAQGLNPDVM